MSNIFTVPFLQALDDNGNPVSNASLYVYEAGTTTPISVYTDVNLSVPATNPVAADASGRFPPLWLSDGQYKFVMKNGQGVEIWSTDRYDVLAALENNLHFINFSSLMGSGISHDEGAILSVQEFRYMVLPPNALDHDLVTAAGVKLHVLPGGSGYNVRAFGATGLGFFDESQTVQKAFNAAARGGSVYFPAGTYKINITMSSQVKVVGEGSAATFIKPWSTDIPVITVFYVTVRWQYSTSFSDFSLESENMTGIGISWGPSNLTTDANNRFSRCGTFRNVYFRGFDKAHFSPYGAIGEEYYSCGMAGNRYGMYSLNDKFSDAAMHAGNKYFYGGEFSGNQCAVYFDSNGTGVEFGGVHFVGTVFEGNNVAAFIKASVQYFPVVFDGCWFEANGQFRAAGSTDIDDWVGGVVGTRSVLNTDVILDGSARVNFVNGSVLGISCLGDDCSVLATGVESRVDPDVGGHPIVTNGNSIVTFDNFTSVGGGRVFGPGVVQKEIRDNNAFKKTISTNAYHAKTRVFQLRNRNHKIFGMQGNVIASNALATQTNTGFGSFAVTGVEVADGVLNASCNEFTRNNFASNEYTSMMNKQAIPTGFCVITHAIKIISGSLRVYSWNRGSFQMLGGTILNINNAGEWITIGGIGYSDGSAEVYPLDFNGQNEDVVWRSADLQMLYFTHYSDALEHLNSRVWAG